MSDLDQPRDAGVTTAEHWARMAEEQVRNPQQRAETGWLDSPLVRQSYIHRTLSGRPDMGWFEWVMKEFVPAGATAACTLGCGSGGLERHARFLGFDATFDSFDISEGALQVAREEAAGHGLEGIGYRQQDLNQVRLDAGRYQVIFASMSLHHILNLEPLFQQIEAALVPGGRLVFNEFIGPRKFQWSDLQLALVNRSLVALPERLRQDLVLRGQIKNEVRRPTLEEMDAIDPSEAALSDQIMPLAHRYLEPVVVRGYGGTLLHLLLDRIVGNFSAEREDDVEILQDLCQLEASCLKTGVLPSDFAVAVFEKS